MLKYETLSKLYYKDKNNYEKEYKLRIQSLSCLHFPIEVNGYEAFVLVIPQLLTLIENIHKSNAELESILHQLPGVARASYERKCLIDEIMTTNDIEGVRSTRKEVALAIDSEDDDKALRFNGLVKKYMLLFDKKKAEIALGNCQDIRTLYDEIVADEISETNKPDGELFRKQSVLVIAGSQQEKHTGIIPEEKIIKAMETSISILHNEEISMLIRISVFHYLIGYIHPFYDGNGRLSRFISSSMLSNELGILVSYRLSFGIKNNKDRYYKAFDICNDKKNRGDLTPFVLFFLETVLDSIKNLKEKATEGFEKLTYYGELLEKAYDDRNSMQKEDRFLLYYLIQNRLFDTDSLNRNQLATIHKVSYPTIKKMMERLMDDGAPIAILKQARTIKYSLDLDEVSDYLEEKISEMSY